MLRKIGRAPLRHTPAASQPATTVEGVKRESKSKRDGEGDGGEKKVKKIPPQPTHAHSAIDRAPGSEKKQHFILQASKYPCQGRRGFVRKTLAT